MAPPKKAVAQVQATLPFAETKPREGAGAVKAKGGATATRASAKAAAGKPHAAAEPPAPPPQLAPKQRKAPAATAQPAAQPAAASTRALRDRITPRTYGDDYVLAPVPVPSRDSQGARSGSTSTSAPQPARRRQQQQQQHLTMTSARPAPSSSDSDEEDDEEQSQDSSEDSEEVSPNRALPESALRVVQKVVQEQQQQRRQQQQRQQQLGLLRRAVQEGSGAAPSRGPSDDMDVDEQEEEDEEADDDGESSSQAAADSEEGEEEEEQQEEAAASPVARGGSRMAAAPAPAPPRTTRSKATAAPSAGPQRGKPPAAPTPALPTRSSQAAAPAPAAPAPAANTRARNSTSVPYGRPATQPAPSARPSTSAARQAATKPAPPAAPKPPAAPPRLPPAQSTAAAAAAQEGAGGVAQRTRSRAPSPAPAPSAVAASAAAQASRPSSRSRHAQEQEDDGDAETSPQKAMRRSVQGRHVRGAKGATQHYKEHRVHDELYRVGDVVYLVATEDQELWPEDDPEEVCVMCHKSECTDANPIIECERCLGGCHIRCARPPLTAVPEGEWLCHRCKQGEDPASHRVLRAPYEKFLLTPPGEEVLMLALVTGFVKNRCGTGELEVLCRQFLRPEDTCKGRQECHGTREVFLSTEERCQPAEAIWGPATVTSAEGFGEEEGTDVYYCSLKYNERCQSFLPCKIGRRKGRDSGGSSEEEEEDDDEEAGGRGWGGGGRRRGGRRAQRRGRRSKQGDDGGGGSSSSSSLGFDSGSSDGDDDDDDFGGLEDEDEEEDGGRAFRPGRGGRGRAPAGRGRALPNALNRQSVAYGDGLESDEEEEDDLLAGSDQQGGRRLLQLAHGGGVSVPPKRAVPNALVNVRQALATAAAPKSLPCRDQEKAELTRFIKQAMAEGGAGAGVLYVCGVPGTGKTACLKEVLRTLMPKAQKSHVQVVLLNALSLPTPGHIYSKLWERMTGQRLGPRRAVAELEAAFSTHLPSGGGGGAGASRGGKQQQRQTRTLLVVDEIDVLITRDQNVLYNLFEWPDRPGSPLAVVGISNTHDLDSRVLQRISSRLASSKLVFNPYNSKNLETIVQERLGQGRQDVVNEVAIRFAARKVAGSSGDVRRVLEVLRRAAEIVDNRRRRQGLPPVPPESADSKNLVTMEDAQQAIKEMYESPHTKFLATCSRLEKLVLVGLLIELRASKKPEVTIQAIHDRMEHNVALLLPDARCELAAVCQLVFELAAKRLLLTSPSWHGIKARVALNVHKDDVCQAVRADASLEAVHAQVA